MWYTVLIIGFAASAYQEWSANIFTTVSDMFPKKAVASVVSWWYGWRTWEYIDCKSCRFDIRPL